MYVKWLAVLAFAVVCITAGCKKNKGSSNIIGDPGRGDTGTDTLVVNPPPDKPENGYNQKAVFTALGTNIGGFYEAVPPKYDTTKKYPLLIFMHGGGERGNGSSELPLVTNVGVAKLLSDKKFPDSFTVNGEVFSFIVICPQFKEWPVPADVDKVVQYALKNYKVDQQRIYMGGLSMGGGATWEYAVNHGRNLAAIVPICGASWPLDSDIHKLAKTDVPTWAFHNSGDSVVTYVSTTKRYVDIITTDNPTFPVKVTLWDADGHNAWTKATDPDYKEDGKNIYEWMLQFKR